jgi:hypothetical protein
MMSLYNGTIQIESESSIEISMPDGSLYVRAMVRVAPSTDNDLVPHKEVVLYSLDCQSQCGKAKGRI